MNSMERVMNTIKGLPVDRVPVFAVLGTYGANLTGTDLRTLYRDAFAHVSAQKALQETFGLDLVIAPFDYSAIAEAFGSEIAWFEKQVPNLKRPAVSTPLEILHRPLPRPYSTGRLPMHLDAVKMLAESYRDQVPLFGIVPGPGSLPALALGLEAWMETLLCAPSDARRILDYTNEFWLEWSNALFESGITALVITEGMATSEVLPRQLFCDLILPHLHATFVQVKGPMVLHHNGGRFMHILDLVPSLPGVLGVSVSSKDDLAESRKKIGPGMLLIGNVDSLSFPTATAEDILEKSLECLHSQGPGRHFILSNSGAELSLQTPPENIHAIRNASIQYARKGSIQ